ncbi:MAG: acyl carrier protein [Pirellulales bacterium]|nr:acyl carrier protein [Pirellulales bacterium]
MLWWFRNYYQGKSHISSDSLTLSTSLNELGADSLDAVEFVMEIEERYDISFPEDAAEQIKTVGDAIRYIQEKRRFDTE